MAWLRLYDDILDDPKIQMLSDRAFRMLINLWCLAKRDDGRIPADIKALSFSLRTKEGRVREGLQALVSAGLLDQADDGYRPHDWCEWQYESDDANKRVRKYRDKIRANGEVVGGHLKHRNAILKRDGDACIYCGSTENLVLDHVVPVIAGGVGELWNLATACRGCNAGKSGRDPVTAGMQFREDRFRVFCHAAIQRVTVTVTAPEAETEQNRTEETPLPPILFDDFWTKFPTEPIMSKPGALQEWEALPPKDQAQAIAAIPGLKAFYAKDKTFPKVSAATFLRERRFEGFAARIVDPILAAEARDKTDRMLRRGKYAEGYDDTAH